MSTPVTPTPPSPPAPPAAPAAPSANMAQVRSDAHQIAADAKAAYQSISATAKQDFSKLLHDIEQAEGTNVDGIRKLFGI